MNIKWLIELLKKSPELFLDTSGLSGAKTLCYQEYYLKIGKKHELEIEYQTLTYFSNYGYCQRPIEYYCNDQDYLLTKKIPGMSCCNQKLIDDPVRLAKMLGKILRIFHDTKFIQCDFSNDRTKILKRIIKNYQQNNLDERIARHLGNLNINDIYNYIDKHQDILIDDVIVHGDYCLPNIFLNQDYQFRGFLDMGRAGIGDRHYDLFWGRWSLAYNLGSDKYGELFYQAYGDELIDRKRLKLMAYISCLDG